MKKRQVSLIGKELKQKLGKEFMILRQKNITGK
jgi:hypothetical protein